MTRITRVLVLGFALACAPFASSLALAQRHAPQHTAVVAMVDARATALARVPGTIRHEELEHEGGRWIYSFEISTGGPGIEEVNVDADTGALVSVEHERH